jgi:hypothetical protein
MRWEKDGNAPSPSKACVGSGLGGGEGGDRETVGEEVLEEGIGSTDIAAWSLSRDSGPDMDIRAPRTGFESPWSRGMIQAFAPRRISQK